MNHVALPSAREAAIPPQQSYSTKGGDFETHAACDQ